MQSMSCSGVIMQIVFFLRRLLTRACLTVFFFTIVTVFHKAPSNAFALLWLALPTGVGWAEFSGGACTIHGKRIQPVGKRGPVSSHGELHL